MRGSPVLRFLLLAIALAATAAGLHRVTSARVGPKSPEAPEKPASAAMSVPFHLTLSAPAAMVEINAGTPLRPSVDEMPVTGTLEMDAANPLVELIVKWKTPVAAGEHRFAKLSLEPPGQETVTHVFDADGDIDDFLELPFPAAK